MKKATKHTKWLHYLYIPADFLVLFVINLLPFLSSYGVEYFNNNVLVILLFAAVSSSSAVLILAIFKIYKMLTHNFGLRDAILVMAIVFVVEIVAFLIAILLPNDILLVDVNYVWAWILSLISSMFVIPALRMGWRIFAIISYRFQNKKKKAKTLIIGAGGAAKIIIDDSITNKNSKNNILVLVDDDLNKIGGTYAGLPVDGPISNAANIIDKYGVEEVIIAISNLENEKLHEILRFLEPCDVRIRRMPLLSEMGSPNVKHIIDVDLDDLLCRDPVKLDNSEVKSMLCGKTVLVTGAGGSIGSELVRQIFNAKPSTLILFDIYENGVYDIQQEILRNIANNKIENVKVITLIGSTYNEVRMEQIFEKYLPDYIYHAAAYKHVPLMEDSPVEAIRTNVVGTYNVAKLADKYKVKKMVLVSTDKAVRPTNVMGATKRFAETIIQYFSEKSKCTVYAAVRFGNVLGSNGSVVPLFKKQIESGGPITITDKNIIRYFMTIPEAVSLILQCGLFANGGEIFILDMGKPVKIINLAMKLIRQAGFVPYKDIDIVETGLRPGEKLYEELLLDTNTQTKTKNNRIYIEQKDKIYPIEDEILTISKVFEMDNNSDIKKMLSSIITTYTIDERKEK